MAPKQQEMKLQNVLRPPLLIALWLAVYGVVRPSWAWNVWCWPSSEILAYVSAVSRCWRWVTDL